MSNVPAYYANPGYPSYPSYPSYAAPTPSPPIAPQASSGLQPPQFQQLPQHIYELPSQQIVEQVLRTPDIDDYANEYVPAVQQVLYIIDILSNCIFQIVPTEPTPPSSPCFSDNDGTVYCRT